MGRLLDKNIVINARGGDPKAVRALVEATQTRLFKFCLVLTGDKARAEDLTQETLVKALDSLHKLNKPEAFIDWLFRIARNQMIDEARRHHETPTAPEDLDEPSTGPMAEYLSVHETLSQFEPEDRHLILLIDMEEYTYKEAADALGLTEDTVRSRIFRLRKEFAEKWQARETK